MKYIYIKHAYVYVSILRFLEPNTSHFKEENRRTSNQGQRCYSSFLKLPLAYRRCSPITETEKLWRLRWVAVLSFAVHFIPDHLYSESQAAFLDKTLNTHTGKPISFHQHSFFSHHYFSLSHLAFCLPVISTGFDEVLHHSLASRFYSIFLNLLWPPSHTHPPMTDSLSLISRLHANTACDVELKDASTARVCICVRPGV